ncbi:hypothetical protein HAALTHF_52410n [Vreelandella aquamarina]|nr:hypothetical protein HAALTHF_52410n [Halomonas axialensis]
MVDVIAIIPTWLVLLVPGAHALVMVRILRVLRIFRILRLMEFVGKAGYCWMRLNVACARFCYFSVAFSWWSHCLPR